MKFITKIRKKSVEPIDESDLIRIKDYQLALVDSLLYEVPRNPNNTTNQKKRDFIFSEIETCEKWLKKNWELFMNSEIKHDTPSIRFSKPERAKLKGGYNRTKIF